MEKNSDLIYPSFFIFFLNPYMYFMAIEDLHWYTPKQLAVLPIFSMSSNVQVCIIYFVFNTRMKVSGFKFFLTLLLPASLLFSFLSHTLFDNLSFSHSYLTRFLTISPFLIPVSHAFWQSLLFSFLSHTFHVASRTIFFRLL